MTKLGVLLLLDEKLSGLPRNDIEEHINFYNEMIEDRIEEGFSEEEAVSAIGDIDTIATQIISDTPFSKIAKEKLKSKRRLKTVEIVFLVLGCPVWLSLLIALFAILLSLYISLWAIIISLWSVFGSFTGCAFAGILLALFFALNNSILTGVAVLGAGLVCAGLSVISFLGCKALTKGALLLTKKVILVLKRSFMKKEKTI